MPPGARRRPGGNHPPGSGRMASPLPQPAGITAQIFNFRHTSQFSKNVRSGPGNAVHGQYRSLRSVQAARRAGVGPIPFPPRGRPLRSPGGSPLESPPIRSHERTGRLAALTNSLSHSSFLIFNLPLPFSRHSLLATLHFLLLPLALMAFFSDYRLFPFLSIGFAGPVRWVFRSCPLIVCFLSVGFRSCPLVASFLSIGFLFLSVDFVGVCFVIILFALYSHTSWNKSHLFQATESAAAKRSTGFFRFGTRCGYQTVIPMTQGTLSPGGHNWGADLW